MLYGVRVENIELEGLGEKTCSVFAARGHDIRAWLRQRGTNIAEDVRLLHSSDWQRSCAHDDPYTLNYHDLLSCRLLLKPLLPSCRIYQEPGKKIRFWQLKELPKSPK